MVFFWVLALQDLMKLRRKESQLNQVIAEAQGATTRLKYSGAELEVLRKKNIVRCQAVGGRTLRGGPPPRSRRSPSLLLLCPQDISRMERELANLESQVRLQQQSVETKEASMEKIRDQISQVASRCAFFAPRHFLQASSGR